MVDQGALLHLLEAVVLQASARWVVRARLQRLHKLEGRLGQSHWDGDMPMEAHGGPWRPMEARAREPRVVGRWGHGVRRWTARRAAAQPEGRQYHTKECDEKDENRPGEPDWGQMNLEEVCPWRVFDNLGHSFGLDRRFARGAPHCRRLCHADYSPPRIRPRELLVRTGGRRLRRAIEWRRTRCWRRARTGVRWRGRGLGLGRGTQVARHK